MRKYTLIIYCIHFSLCKLQKRQEQRIKEEGERKHARLRAIELPPRLHDPLSRHNSQISKSIHNRPNDIQMQHIPRTTVQDDPPETQSVNSFSPRYIDREISNKRNEYNIW